MASHLLSALSMHKYERLLPRLFPGAARLEIANQNGELVWQWRASENDVPSETSLESPVVAWAESGGGVTRRSMPDGKTQFRSGLASREHGNIGWLIVEYDAQITVPIGSAPAVMRRAFIDATTFLQEELELQSECDQLAAELTERYEELNLVYATDDQVEYFEEGQEALVRLVHNCADYLDVGMAALICRDRGLVLQEVNRSESPEDPEEVVELLSSRIYDRVESQVKPIVLNELDDKERHRLFADRDENLVAYPIIDDHGTAIGVLSVVARQDLHTFSNGDRNLLEVMAKKASRIIHTHHDSLTGLMNRSGFESSLVSALATTRSKSVEHCVLHIDLDQLHVVNDLMGYQEGDKLIRRVSRLLRQSLRDTDVLARLGGDEFGVLLSGCNLRQGVAIAEKIANAMRGLEVIAANRQLSVSVSIGLASMTHQTEGIVGLLASAEIACKSAKEGGRDRIEVFEQDNSMLVRRSEEIEWIGRVQQALREDDFVLYGQPVMPLQDDTVPAHYEILLRLQGEDGDVLSPAIFMPAAERYQLMPLVDRWVIRNALKLIGESWDALASKQPIFCINLSGQSLTNIGFLAFVLDELSDSGVPPENICFEITETAAISNFDDATVLIDHLQRAGCRFALDDFGAGLSSFGYLKVLPVDYLKIDGSFVREMRTDKVSKSMVEAICGIGRTMGLKVIAEFVGDAETADMLREIGADFAQGYGIGKPVPMAEITERLTSPSKIA